VDLMARRVEASAKRFVIRNDTIESLPKFVGVGTKEPDRILKLFNFTLERSFFVATGSVGIVAACASTRGRNPPHHVAHKAFST
jgi:hypothetical protein